MSTTLCEHYDFSIEVPEIKITFEKAQDKKNTWLRVRYKDYLVEELIYNDDVFVAKKEHLVRKISELYRVIMTKILQNHLVFEKNIISE